MAKLKRHTAVIDNFGVLKWRLKSDYLGFYSVCGVKFSAFSGQNGRFGIIGIFLLAEFLRYK